MPGAGFNHQHHKNTYIKVTVGLKIEPTISWLMLTTILKKKEGKEGGEGRGGGKERGKEKGRERKEGIGKRKEERLFLHRRLIQYIKASFLVF